MEPLSITSGKVMKPLSLTQGKCTQLKTDLYLHFLVLQVKSLSLIRLFVTPWTVAYEAPPSMGFSSQEYWSGLPFPSPGDLPNPGTEPGSPALQTDTLLSKPKTYLNS